MSKNTLKGDFFEISIKFFSQNSKQNCSHISAISNEIPISFGRNEISFLFE